MKISFFRVFNKLFFYVGNPRVLIQGPFGRAFFFLPRYNDYKTHIKKGEDFFYWGYFNLQKKLFRILIGISVGFLFKLKINGIGFKGKLKKNLNNFFLSLTIGYNHNLNIKIPSNIKLTINKGIFLIITSNSFNSINLFYCYLKRFNNIH